MSGINIMYCVDGFNNFPCDNPRDAGMLAKVADYCHFYSIDHGDLINCKNAWVDPGLYYGNPWVDPGLCYGNPIQSAVMQCNIFFAYDENSFNIIKHKSYNPALFDYIDKHLALRGWYFYNYMVSTDKFNDDCFLPLEGNEELFAKQYSIDIEELYKIASV